MTANEISLSCFYFVWGEILISTFFLASGITLSAVNEIVLEYTLAHDNRIRLFIAKKIE